MNSEGGLSVLVVDDDVELLSLVERLLRSSGLRVTTASASIGVSNLVRRVMPDVVVVDVNIPALSGDALITLVRRHAPPQTRFVLYSSCDESELRAIARRIDADGWISKSNVSSLADYIKKLPPRSGQGKRS